MDTIPPVAVSRRLTFALAGLMTVQSLLGLTARGQYRDVDWITATWFGNDWLTLVVAVPLLLISGAAARSGSTRAFLLWAGGVAYAVYNYAFYLLGAALNVFFPLYVGAVVLAAVILIRTLGRLDPSSIGVIVRPLAPLPLIGGSLVLIGVGLAVVWTAMWAAYVFAERPTPVDIEVFRLVAALDLSLMVPAELVVGVTAWPWGFVGRRSIDLGAAGGRDHDGHVVAAVERSGRNPVAVLT